MLVLPHIHGKYPVGLSTFVTPARPPRPIGSIKLRQHSGLPSQEPALRLEEVAFSVYYPADISSAPSERGAPWPLSDYVHGFALFLGISSWLLWPVVYLFGAFIQIPAYPNAPLLRPHSDSNDKSHSSRWPLVIFSHGLGGGRTAYSQYCSRLAASGKVVLAVEHRDGTGIACHPRVWHSNGKSSPRHVYWLRSVDISYENGEEPEPQPLPLRTEQLAFRHRELYITYSTFSKFVSGDSTVELENIDGSPIDKLSWTCVDTLSNEPIINVQDNVTLAGHSFGGCTVLSILSSEPEEGYTRIPVNHAIILDPWLEPFPSPAPAPVTPSSTSSENALSSSEHADESTSANKSLSDAVPSSYDNKPASGSQYPRMLVINSETFTIWKDHFARLQDIINGWKSEGNKILTLIGSEHVSFSDFHVLPLLGKKGGQLFLDLTTKLSLAFLDDRLKESIETEVSLKDMKIEVIGVKKDGKPKRKLVGQKGDVIAH